MDRKVKLINSVKLITGFGLILGFIALLSCLFVNGVKMDYLLSISMALIISSMSIFGFSVFLGLMDESTTDRTNLSNENEAFHRFSAY